MATKLDRRKKYTRMVLKDSLIQLLKEKPISAITVKEICQRADINRSTFYAHYADQHDLLNKIEEEIIVDMAETLSRYNLTQEEEALEMTEKILEYIAANKEICQILLSDHGDVAFQKRMMAVTQNYIIKWHQPQDLDETITQYITLFVLSGCIQVIIRWLETGLKKSPKEMAQLINQCVNRGLSGL